MLVTQPAFEAVPATSSEKQAMYCTGRESRVTLTTCVGSEHPAEISFMAPKAIRFSWCLTGMN